MCVVILSIIGVLVLVCLWWRIISRYRAVPWPYWLAFMLENPYMIYFSKSSTLVGYLGLEPGMRVLDAGCGAGRIAVPAAVAVGSKGHVIGLDMQEKMLSKAWRRAQKIGVENIDFILGEFGQGVLPHESFDRAVMVTVLGEIPDRAEALKEIYDSLKSGGVFSITEVIPDPCYQTKAQVVKMCRNIGLEPVQSWSNLVAYTVNFKKVIK